MKEILVKWLGWESYCEWFHSVHTDKSDHTKWYCEECRKSYTPTQYELDDPAYICWECLLKLIEEENVFPSHKTPAYQI